MPNVLSCCSDVCELFSGATAIVSLYLYKLCEFKISVKLGTLIVFNGDLLLT